mgnify:CR=1 FL=1
MATLPFDTGKLVEICRKNDVLKIGVFGSVARGEATDQSDVDLLVYFSKPKSLLTLVALERQISTALGRKGQESGPVDRGGYQPLSARKNQA